jgi:uncharacterized DUF497 family protein
VVDLSFEWDERKAEENRRRHDVHFADAVRVWADPARDERIDDRRDYGEDRWITVGMTPEGELIPVVYTVRAETIRLISARPSTATECHSCWERLR